MPTYCLTLLLPPILLPPPRRPALQTLAEYVDDTEDLVQVQLDSRQNKILALHNVLNAFMGCLSLSVAVTALFAMNLSQVRPTSSGEEAFAAGAPPAPPPPPYDPHEYLSVRGAGGWRVPVPVVSRDCLSCYCCCVRTRPHSCYCCYCCCVPTRPTQGAFCGSPCPPLWRPSSSSRPSCSGHGGPGGCTSSSSQPQLATGLAGLPGGMLSWHLSGLASGMLGPGRSTEDMVSVGQLVSGRPQVVGRLVLLTHHVIATTTMLMSPDPPCGHPTIARCQSRAAMRIHHTYRYSSHQPCSDLNPYPPRPGVVMVCSMAGSYISWRLPSHLV